MRRIPRRALAGIVGAVAAAGAGMAAERYLLRQARAVPDPDRDETLTRRPSPQRRVRSFDGTELALAEVGPTVHGAGGADRPALVFVHGFSLDMTAWHFQWTRLSRRSRCVLFDHRGHGRSAAAAGGDYSIDALGKDLKAVLDHAVPRGPAVLIGHSVGGMAILSLASQFPELFGTRVRGVVLANTTASDLLREALGGLAVQAAVVARSSLSGLIGRTGRVDWIRRQAAGRGGGLAYLIARATNFGADAPPSVVGHVTRISVATPTEVWTQMLQGLFELDLADALEHVSVPALVLAGDVDRLVPAASALAIKRRLPDAEMVVFRGAGHCSMLERPDQFNDVVEAFLRRVGRAAPAEGTEALVALGRRRGAGGGGA